MTMFGATMDAATMEVADFDFEPDAFSLFLSGARPAAVIVQMVGQSNSPAILDAEFEPTMGEATMTVNVPPSSVAPQISLWFSSDGRKFDHDDVAGPNLSTMGRLASRVETRSTIDIEATSRTGAVISVADIEVLDQDRRVSQTLFDYNFDGLPTRIFLGPKGADRSAYRLIATAFGIDQRASGDGKLTFRQQDLQFGLAVPIQTRAFAGTGALEGDPSLSGRLKPRLIGRRVHFQPVLINAGERWWMYNDGEATGVLAAYYGGEAIPVTQVDDFLAFASATVPEGEAVDCPALGIIRDRPAGGIDAPFAIDAIGDSQFSESARAGDLIAKALRAFGAFTIDQLNLPSLAALNIIEGGFWADGSAEVTLRALAEALSADAGGRLIPAARIAAFSLNAPETVGAEFNIREAEIRSMRIDGRYSRPIASLRVSYRPNDLVLSEDQVLLPEVNPAWKRYVQTSGDLTDAIPDARIGLVHRDIEVLATVQSSAVDRDGAALVADRLRQWFSRERRVFEIVTTSRRALISSVGTVVRVDHRGYPFAGGRNATIVKIDPNFDSLTTRMRVVL